MDRERPTRLSDCFSEAGAGESGFFESERIALTGRCGVDDRPGDAFARRAFVAEGAAALDDLGPGPVESVA
jgi:hypothetical protein